MEVSDEKKLLLQRYILDGDQSIEGQAVAALRGDDTCLEYAYFLLSVLEPAATELSSLTLKPTRPSDRLLRLLDLSSMQASDVRPPVGARRKKERRPRWRTPVLRRPVRWSIVAVTATAMLVIGMAIVLAPTQTPLKRVLPTGLAERYLAAANRSRLLCLTGCEPTPFSRGFEVGFLVDLAASPSRNEALIRRTIDLMKDHGPAFELPKRPWSVRGLCAAAVEPRAIAECELGVHAYRLRVSLDLGDQQAFRGLARSHEAIELITYLDERYRALRPAFQMIRRRAEGGLPVSETEKKVWVEVLSKIGGT